MTKPFEEGLKNLSAKEIEEQLYPVSSETGIVKYYKENVLLGEFENWHSDEEFKKLKESLNIASNELSRLSCENTSLKFKVLPEVPEFVASWIEYWKSSGRGSISIDKALTEGADLPDFKKVHAWLSEYEKKHDENAEPFENMNGVELPNVTLFIRAWLDGYTVQKPKRFYLKNKITGDLLLRKNSGYMDDYCEVSEGNLLNKKSAYFTQEEIDSMQTGSYEKIEVEE